MRSATDNWQVHYFKDKELWSVPLEAAGRRLRGTGERTLRTWTVSAHWDNGGEDDLLRQALHREATEAASPGGQLRAQMDAALDPPSPPLPRRPPAEAQVDVGGELEHRSPGGGEHGETGRELEVDETGMELEDDEPGCDDDVAMDDAGVEEDKGDGNTGC